MNKPDIKFDGKYYFFIFEGRRYTSLTVSGIGQLLHATVEPVSIHNRPVRVG